MLKYNNGEDIFSIYPFGRSNMKEPNYDLLQLFNKVIIVILKSNRIA